MHIILRLHAHNYMFADTSLPKYCIFILQNFIFCFRVIKDGAPTMLCVGLANIEDAGDATAANIKSSLDNMFSSLGLQDEWENNLISVAADGASVNTGAKNGLFVRLAEDRPWIIATHCVSHKLELALKNSIMKQKQFDDVKEFMTGLYYYCKRSGKFVRHVKETAALLNVSMLKMPKVHGTRFLNHQRKGVGALIHNWVLYIQGIENSLESSRGNTNAKLLGFLKKLKSIKFLYTALLYSEILDVVAPLSLKFQESNLQVFEIVPAVSEATALLGDVTDDSIDEDYIATKYGIRLDSQKLSQNLLKAGHNKRAKNNQEHVTLEYNGMCGDASDIKENTKTLSETSVQSVRDCLDARFSSFRDLEILKCCQWLDPANWDSVGTEASELDSMHKLAKHFEKPLSKCHFHTEHLKNEWKALKVMANDFYMNHSVKSMWQKILKHKQHKFPNVCLLASIIQCLGISTATVESGFSHLTAILTDCRVSMSHSTMDDLLSIKVNDLQWRESEREALINVALDSYLKSRRLGKLDSSDPSSDSSDSDSDSDCSESEVIVNESDLEDSTNVGSVSENEMEEE